MPHYNLSRNADHTPQTLWKVLCGEGGDVFIAIDKLWKYVVQKRQTVDVARRFVWFLTTLKSIEDIWRGWAGSLKNLTYVHLREGGRPWDNTPCLFQ